MVRHDIFLVRHQISCQTEKIQCQIERLSCHTEKISYQTEDISCQTEMISCQPDELTCQLGNTSGQTDPVAVSRDGPHAGQGLVIGRGPCSLRRAIFGSTSTGAGVCCPSLTEAIFTEEAMVPSYHSMPSRLRPPM